MLKLLKHLTKREGFLALLCIAFVVVQVWLDLKLPDYMSTVTRLVQTEGSKMIEILKNGGYMLLCAFGSMAAAMIVGFFAAQIAAGLSKRLRSDVFEKTLQFSMKEINTFSTASLITRCTNDITQIQMVIAMGLQVMIKAPILAVWAILKILGKGWQWTLATGVAVAILIVVLMVIYIFAVPRFKLIQNLTDNLNRVTRENLTGLRIVRAYNAEEYQGEKFEGANGELTSTHLFVGRIMALIMPTMTLIMSGISLVIYWVGAYMIDAAGVQDKVLIFSDMVVFSAYAVQVIIAFMMVSMITIMLPRAMVSARRINEVLDTEVSIKDGDRVDAPRTGTIEFKNVRFKYPDASDMALEDINFSVNKGETVAFIGSTGSGKTTLVNLIPRFYDVTEGELLVDGINVKAFSEKELRNRIGYVSQKAILFYGSIKNNIDFGENGAASPSANEIKEAARAAQAEEFIDKMPGGLEAHISQGGANVSGGQKQRLSIARAIAKKPEIYIFDDSFSALDYKTDKNLRSELKVSAKDATVLIVAQRIGTIKDADKIVVMSDGKIVGIGTHKELLEGCEVYKEIAYSQLSEEELKNA